jgi:hypothetical protein
MLQLPESEVDSEASRTGFLVPQSATTPTVLTGLPCTKEGNHILIDHACQTWDKSRITDDSVQDEGHRKPENEAGKIGSSHQDSSEKKRMIFLNPERATKYQKLLQSLYDSDEIEESDAATGTQKLQSVATRHAGSNEL